MAHEASLAQIAAAKGRFDRDFIVARVRAFQASYAAKDWKGRASLLSDDVIFEDTVGVPPPAIGRSAAEEYFKLIIDSGWDIEMTPERIVVMGDKAFVVTIGSWSFDGAPPSRLLLIHNFRFNAQGDICHVRIAYDEDCLIG